MGLLRILGKIKYFILAFLFRAYKRLKFYVNLLADFFKLKSPIKHIFKYHKLEGIGANNI